MAEPVTPPNPADGGGTRSTPDPTLLTIDSIRREIAMLGELVDTRLDGLAALTAERFNSVDRLMEASEKLRNERFDSMHTLMERGEEQRREQKSDTAAAVSAALESQKEATAKMEKSISDQITSLRSNFDTSIQGISSHLADLKDRMTTQESIKQGQAEQKTEARQVSAGMIALIGVGVTVILAVLTIIAFATRMG